MSAGNSSVKNNNSLKVNMNMSPTGKDLVYLYCVTDKVPQVKEMESLADKLYFICYQDLYAIVSNVKQAEFNEENLKKNLANLEWVKIKVNIHERVIEWLMKDRCVIPFKFGTIFNNKDNLELFLDKYAEELKANLINFKDKEEWGVKIYCDIHKLKKKLIQEDKEIMDIDKKIGSSPPGKAFFLKKKREELVKTTINKKLNDYGQKGFDGLKEHSLEARINKLLPKEVTERKEDMILNAAFLINKNNVSAFVNTVDTLKAQYEDKGLFFICTGPWPPYNFCVIGNPS